LTANNFPQVINGAPVDADAWFNAVAQAVTALQSQLASPVGDTGNTSRGSVTSSSYTSSLTSSTDTPITASFVAPQSGAVTVTTNALLIASGTTFEALMSFQITRDSDSAVILAADDKRAISATNINIRLGRVNLVQGLAAGVSYTATAMFRVNLGAGPVQFDAHDLVVSPR
jgi:hypothetical protein